VNFRVFPGLGNLRAWPLPRANGGGPLIYNNFRARVRPPMLKRLGIPQVTPYSARHSFISALQFDPLRSFLISPGTGGERQKAADGGT
jgi:integrase